MSKILGSWSGVRKYLEQEMLCESLRGRIRYDCATYTSMDGCSVFRIYVDNKEVKRFSHETVNSYFIEMGLKEKDTEKDPQMAYWENYWGLLEEYPVTQRTEYTDEEFCDALALYRNQEVQISIASSNPIVVMLALLDRRVGERTLQKIEKDMELQPQWVREIYRLRIEAEKR